MGFLSRTPFALLGALSLLSFWTDVVQFEENIENTIRIWQAVTYPPWEYLFGIIFENFSIKLPDLAKDYFTFGLITVGMHFRATRFLEAMLGFRLRGFVGSLVTYLIVFLIWPIVVFTVFREFLRGSVHREVAYVFFETLIYAFLVIIVSEILIYKGLALRTA